jgi:hypothetical protein
MLTGTGFQSNQSGENSSFVRISSPPRDSNELDLRRRLDEAFKKLPWMAFQNLIERQGMFFTVGIQSVSLTSFSPQCP